MDIDSLVDKVKKILEREEKSPFIVSVMGQTGVGKSSLINALFGTQFKVSPTSPGTEKIEADYVKGREGDKLVFYDLPGVGVSKKVDDTHFAEYEKKLEESDVILWAIHSDSRSFSYDLDALDHLFTSVTTLSKFEILNKMIFVLTKVDLLTPPPWILAKTGDSAIFAPQEDTLSLLREKEDYIQKNFILPDRESLTSRTYFKGDFTVDDDRFQYADGEIYYKGVLTKEDVELLKKRFPLYQEVFDRLYDNYCIVSCSARFRFNLDLLTRLIINKLGTKLGTKKLGASAIARFSNLYADTDLYTIPLAKAKEFSNIVVVDHEKKKIIFDLTSAEL